ncbi:hypothetical protein SCHIN_v1c10940 [Spiroplasma chinense]|uniref:Lipoprotein n=1 Tax=Spiroplasma chinense TaxID=216932 RepID=A0A5B9Y7I7_9MOLU|nr:hypothetical protein [Spiroplasma chinense]QEH62287.1 hypothetical protein SCHIN_v1c10940 [Spiroplasma chinense]
MKKILLKLLSATVLTVPTSLAVSCEDPKHNVPSEPEPEETFWWQDYEIQKFDSAIDYLKANLKNHTLTSAYIYNNDLKGLSGKKLEEIYTKTLITFMTYNFEDVRDYIDSATQSYERNREYNYDIKDKNEKNIFNVVYNEGSYTGGLNSAVEEKINPLIFNDYKNVGDEKNLLLQFEMHMKWIQF